MKKNIYFHNDFSEVCSQGSNQRHSSIGSDDGLAPSRRQAIIRANDDLVYWRNYASLGLNDLNLNISYELSQYPDC